MTEPDGRKTLFTTGWMIGGAIGGPTVACVTEFIAELPIAASARSDSPDCPDSSDHQACPNHPVT